MHANNSKQRNNTTIEQIECIRIYTIFHNNKYINISSDEIKHLFETN